MNIKVVVEYPVPYDQEGKREDNQEAAHKLIREKLNEFQEYGYDLAVLASICAKESYSSMGRYLSRYWNDGNWS